MATRCFQKTGILIRDGYMCISSEQYIARPDGLANNNIPIAENARPTKVASTFNKGLILAQHSQNP